MNIRGGGAAIALAAALLAPLAATAAEVAGIRIDDAAKAGEATLPLNGAGLRSRLFFKVYVAALYAPRKTASATELIEAAEPRRLVLHLLRDLEAATLVDALRDGLAANHGAAELAALQADSERFAALMQAIGTAKSGDVIALDFTAQGTAVSFNGQGRGSIAGAAFAKALLKVWLGERPVQADLKNALLGGQGGN